MVLVYGCFATDLVTGHAGVDLVHHENHTHPSNHDHRVTCYFPAEIHHVKNHHGHRGHALAQSHHTAQYQTAQNQKAMNQASQDQATKNP